MQPRLIVLKLGGSVLASEASLPRAVHEIHRWRRAGYAVVAVVSAFAGDTDRLLDRARALGAAPASSAAAAATGELLSAALLGAALDRAGVPSSVLTPAALALRAEGPPLEATPAALERARIDAVHARGAVAIIPGFAALDARGCTVLLGRGGSDLSALFLAHALGARCWLVKDVDGLYEWDPARSGPAPRRYTTGAWEDALATDGTILQHRAVSFARERRLAFEVAALGSDASTIVGAGPSRFSHAPGHARPLRVALLGLGTVGGGVWELARGSPAQLEISAVCCRDLRRAEALGVPREILHSEALETVQAVADVVVECLGGLEPASSTLRAALESGRAVVTANKRVLAEHGLALRRLARERDLRLLGSAAVGGSAPVLERAAAHVGRLRGVRGVLNGTVNFLIERAVAGCDLDSALGEAQALGLTEADAARDIDGRDAADKLRVIAGVLGVDHVAVERQPLDCAVVRRARSAAERGACVRQVAELELGRTGALGWVHFLELEAGDPLFDVPAAANAAVLLDGSGPLELVTGVGAGRWPTAESVVGDLLALERTSRPERLTEGARRRATSCAVA